jgi:hypothetical protein
MYEPDIINIISHLQNQLKPFDQIEEIKDVAGIYAIALNASDFPFFNDPRIVEGTILYVGKSESSIKKRVYKSHFSNNKTGSSTVRRSLGAILKEDLELEPIPRSIKEKKFRDYAFIYEGEVRLTNWMVNNLSVSFYDYPHGKKQINDLESKIIKRLIPVLNLKKNVSLNPHLSELEELRAKCKDIARIRFEKDTRI